jgi:hypothetical protein
MYLLWCFIFVPIVANSLVDGDEINKSFFGHVLRSFCLLRRDNSSTLLSKQINAVILL